MSQVLEALVSTIDGQLAELEPIVRDYETLRQIRDSIAAGQNGSSNGNGHKHRRRGHAIPLGQRLEALVREAQDGISVKDAAQRLGTSPTYVYAVVKNAPHVVAEGGRLSYTK